MQRASNRIVFQPLDAVKFCMEVITQDIGMLRFDFSRLTRKFKDLTREHVVFLLNLRGDLTARDIDEFLAEFRIQTYEDRTIPNIFSQVQVPGIIGRLSSRIKLW